MRQTPLLSKFGQESREEGKENEGEEARRGGRRDRGVIFFPNHKLDFRGAPYSSVS